MIYNWLSAAAGRGGLQRPRWDTQVFRCRCASFHPCPFLFIFCFLFLSNSSLIIAWLCSWVIFSPGETQVFRCRCASFYPFISVPPFILVLSLFPLFFFCQARVQSLSGLVTGVSLMLWGVEFDHWLAVPSQKLLMLKMILNKIRINILRLFNRLHEDVAQQNISRQSYHWLPLIPTP